MQILHEYCMHIHQKYKYKIIKVFVFRYVFAYFGCAAQGTQTQIHDKVLLLKVRITVLLYDLV